MNKSKRVPSARTALNKIDALQEEGFRFRKSTVDKLMTIYKKGSKATKADKNYLSQFTTKRAILKKSTGFVTISGERLSGKGRKIGKLYKDLSPDVSAGLAYAIAKKKQAKAIKGILEEAGVTEEGIKKATSGITEIYSAVTNPYKFVTSKAKSAITKALSEAVSDGNELLDTSINAVLKAAVSLLEAKSNEEASQILSGLKEDINSIQATATAEGDESQAYTAEISSQDGSYMTSQASDALEVYSTSQIEMIDRLKEAQYLYYIPASNKEGTVSDSVSESMMDYIDVSDLATEGIEEINNHYDDKEWKEEHPYQTFMRMYEDATQPRYTDSPSEMVNRFSRLIDWLKMTVSQFF